MPTSAGSHLAPRALIVGSLFALTCCATLIGVTASQSDAIPVTPSYSATGVCVGGVSQFAYTFFGLPQNGATVVTLGIFDTPDREATGTPVSVGPGTTTILWNLNSPLFGAGEHVISVNIGSSGIPAVNLPAVPFWPVSSSYQIVLPQCGAAPSPFVAIASTPDDQGYWQATADGQVLGFGSAQTFGSMSGTVLNHPIVGMASTPSGNGYWLVASDGGVFSFGDAPFYGSTGDKVLNKPVVGMAATPTGHGYWFVASDGGIFSFGDAAFYGSTGSLHLYQPVVGMAATPDGQGYYLVAKDGGIFTFGDAYFKGSVGGRPLGTPVVGMAIDPATGGYWEVAADGGIFTYGDAKFVGSAASMHLGGPVVAIAPRGG